jgi:hypothetical protein
MPFAIAISLVILISTALLLYQFLAGTLIGADDESPAWPHRARRAH